MANGDYFTKEELRELIKPLEVLKEAINSYAKEEGLDTIYYYKAWPGIDLAWKNTNSLKCEIYLSMNKDRQSYVMGVHAWIDIEKKRYSISKKLHEHLQTPFNIEFIISEIKRGFEMANEWKFEDLTFSTMLK